MQRAILLARAGKIAQDGQMSGIGFVTEVKSVVSQRSPHSLREERGECLPSGDGQSPRSAVNGRPTQQREVEYHAKPPFHAMNDQADLLRTICRQPDDDAPRLIYADWLEEQGDDERAAFIRLSVSMMSGLLSEHESWQAGIRYRQLEVTVVPRLMDQMPRLVGATWQPIVDRGFIARIEFYQPTSFIRDWTRIFDMAPIRFLTLNQLDDSCLSDFYDIPVLEQLRSLHIHETNLSRNGWTTLLRLAQWAKLYHLDLANNALGDEGVQALAQSSALLNLRSINLEENSLTDQSATALISSPYLKHLRRVFVRGNSLSPTAMQLLRRRFEFVFAIR